MRTGKESPDGIPPTFAEWQATVATRGRNYTDGPLGHRRPGIHYTTADTEQEPDILRRLNDPVPGERTPAHAAALRRGKARRAALRRPKALIEEQT